MHIRILTHNHALMHSNTCIHTIAHIHYILYIEMHTCSHTHAYVHTYNADTCMRLSRAPIWLPVYLLTSEKFLSLGVSFGLYANSCVLPAVNFAINENTTQ